MPYFDHCATTPPYEEVIAAISEVMRRYYGNPSSLHRLGIEAERLLKQAREVIAGLLHVRSSEIYFTSGGTESNNLAIKGAAGKYRNRGNHLITSQIEHASVLRSFEDLEREGFRVTYLPVDGTGCVQLDALEANLSEDTILVSIMHVNNEMGRIQPIERIGRLLAAYPKILFHVDAVQSVGKIPLDIKGWGIDLLSLSAHKFRGPKGSGILYKRQNLQIAPLFSGGGQESGLRSGTENVAQHVAAAKALRMTMENSEQAGASKRLYHYRKLLTDQIGRIPKLVLNGSGHESEMAPHIINFSFPGMKSEAYVHALEKHDIFVSSQSACSSGEEKPSKVLMAMGCGAARARSGIRISLSPMHTMADIEYLMEKLAAVTAEMDKGVRIG